LRAVVLAAPPGALAEIAERLRARGVELVEIREPDAPFLGALTALGLLPIHRREVGRILGGLPLYPALPLPGEST
jgi:hypothetical protein